MGDAELAGQNYLESPPAIGRTRSSSADSIVCTVGHLDIRSIAHLFLRLFDPTHLFEAMQLTYPVQKMRYFVPNRNKNIYYRYIIHIHTYWIWIGCYLKSNKKTEY